MPPTNKQITLAARPSGMPKESDFKLVETPIPQPGPGEILLRMLYVSVDPYMRGRMNDAKSYAPPVQIGGVMGGGAVGKVVASQNPQFAAGHFRDDVGQQVVVSGYFQVRRRAHDHLKIRDTTDVHVREFGDIALFGLGDPSPLQCLQGAQAAAGQ